MEKFDSELQMDQFIRPSEATHVTSSKDFMEGQWRALTHLRNSPDGVKKSVVPVDLSDIRFMVITTVEAGAEIKAHSHDEAIIRYITSGDLTLNGVNYETGDWVLVPANADYEIKTTGGYTAVAGYGVPCDR